VEGIGGPVKIAQATGDASRFGLPIMIQFAAMLSVNLGLMNLLPLPALDGGRILFLGYELVARRPFNPKWEGLVHAAGMIMLLSFMLFITLRDVNAGALLERFTN
jgi:regulator of sigma E protease